MKTANLFTLFCFLSANILSAQTTISRSVIASAGATGSSGSIVASWTAGETVTATFSQSSIALTQGFQQPDDDFVSIEKVEAGFNIKVYPNPTDGWITFECFAEKSTTFQFSIYDVNGRKIAYNNNAFTVTGHVKKQFNLSALAQGNYFLRITANEEILDAIQIIKTY